MGEGQRTTFRSKFFLNVGPGLHLQLRALAAWIFTTVSSCSPLLCFNCWEWWESQHLAMLQFLLISAMAEKSSWLRVTSGCNLLFFTFWQTWSLMPWIDKPRHSTCYSQSCTVIPQQKHGHQVNENTKYYFLHRAHGTNSQNPESLGSS